MRMFRWKIRKVEHSTGKPAGKTGGVRLADLAPDGRGRPAAGRRPVRVSRSWGRRRPPGVPTRAWEKRRTEVRQVKSWLRIGAISAVSLVMAVMPGRGSTGVLTIGEEVLEGTVCQGGARPFQRDSSSIPGMQQGTRYRYDFDGGNPFILGLHSAALFPFSRGRSPWGYYLDMSRIEEGTGGFGNAGGPLAQSGRTWPDSESRAISALSCGLTQPDSTARSSRSSRARRRPPPDRAVTPQTVQVRGQSFGRRQPRQRLSGRGALAGRGEGHR